MGKRYIYKIHDDSNSWCYVGSTCNPKQRFRDHKDSMSLTRHTPEEMFDMYSRMADLCNGNKLKMSILEEIETDDYKNARSTFPQEDRWIKHFMEDDQVICLNQSAANAMGVKEMHQKARETNIERYGLANGAGGLAKAYDTNRANHDGVLAYHTADARINNEFSRLKLLYYSGCIFSGVPVLHQYLREEGHEISLAKLYRLVEGQPGRKNQDLVGKIISIDKGSELESRIKEYIRKNFDISEKVFPVPFQIGGNNGGLILGADFLK